jgi:predicted DsbA family dithiol-disulfide isomerase
MKVQIWSDFVCPFCYIGKRRLEQAIERFPNELQIEVEYKSFQLDPLASIYQGKSIHEAIAEKYNIPVDRAIQSNMQIGEQAKAVGLHFAFDTMKPTNTFDAHRLSKYAKTIGKEEAFVNEMLYQYFTLSALISDHDTLMEIAKKVGLPEKEVDQILRNQDMYANEVNSDQQLASQLRITGVPFFIFNDKFAISGAQPIETFMQALEKVLEDESKQWQDLSSHQGSYCDGDNCK